MYKRYDGFSIGLFAHLVDGVELVDSPILVKQIIEAKEVGMTLLSRTNHRVHRYYRFDSCGHKWLGYAGAIKDGNTRCMTCSLFRSVKYLQDVGAQLIYRKNSLCVGIKKCGHISTAQRLRFPTYCQECLENSYSKYCKDKGDWTYIGTKGEKIGARRWVSCNKCGTEKIVQMHQLPTQWITCENCFNEQIVREAKEAGLIFNGKSKYGGNKPETRRNYTMPCGHDRDIRLDHVRQKAFKCNICKGDHKDFPSVVYLLKIRVGDFEFLKFGFSKNVDNRVKMYKFKVKDYKIDILHCSSFNDGNSAYSFEQKIHSKYCNLKIDKSITQSIMRNGGTECYPVEMQDILLGELKQG